MTASHLPQKISHLVLTLFCAIFSLAILLPRPTQAAKFANQFIEFEMPPRWQCNLEGAEWVCQSTEEAKKREAIIVLAAKLRGDQDNLDQYLGYLKTPKNWTNIQGKPMHSTPKYAKMVQINGNGWADSLHLDSELQSFYTRYLATTKADIAVLVTFSVNQKKYQEHLQDVENMVKTLKVFRKAGGINSSAGSSLFDQVKVPDSLSPNSVFPAAPAPAEQQKEQPKKEDDSVLLPLLLGGVVIGYLIWRRRQNRL